MNLAEGLMEITGENAEHLGVQHWLDTGIPELNKILSNNHSRGFPVGRMVEIYGGASCGKCQPASTMILGQDGLVSIGEMFELCGYKPSSTTKVVEHEYKLVNENAEFETTSHLTWNGKRPIKRIVGEFGFATEATNNHPLRVLNKRGRIVWKKAGDVEVGDALPIMRNTRQFGTGRLTPDEARFIGYLVADGTLSRTEKFGLSNSDPDIERIYRGFVHDVLGLKTSENGSDDRTAKTWWTFGAANRVAMTDKYGLDLCKAAGKVVPLCVRTASYEAQVAFLRGYFECECHIDAAKGVIDTVSASRKLLSDIQLMLLNLGIVSRLSEKIVDGVTYYRLVMNNGAATKYISEIGFDTAARQAVASQCRPTERSPGFDVIPNIGEVIESIFDGCDTDREGHLICKDYFERRPVGYKGLNRVIEYLGPRVGPMTYADLDHLKMLAGRDFFYETVAAIEDDEVPTFDVALPKTHSFWANGFISHNTFIATMAMAAAQKLGGVAGFSDHERTFEPKLAGSLGLKVSGLSDGWIYKRPQTFEESMDIAVKTCELVRQKGLIDPAAPMIWVFDSVASMVPHEKLFDDKGKRREAGSYNMRDKLLLAASCSQNYPVLSQFAEDNNMLVLLLNQTREKPGVMYGNPLAVPGGKAAEFYASIRLELNRTEITNGKKGPDKEILGFEIGAKTVKNKVARFGRKATWEVRFNKGLGVTIDQVSTNVKYLKKLGAIETAGNRVVWDGKNIYESQLIAQLQADPDAHQKLMALLPEDDDEA